MDFFKKIILVFTVLISFSHADPVVKPTDVIIGAYPMMLHNFNYAGNSFDINFYLWTVTKNPTFDPKKSLEITNAIKYDLKNEVKGINKDGSLYTTLHYYATCRYTWDIRSFPFDRQLLRVDVEDGSDINHILFIPDTDGSHMHPELKIPGWKIKKFYIEVDQSNYASGLGDFSTKSASYSAFSFYIDMKRKGARLFVNYFVGFFTSFVLCILIFAMRPSDIDKRINLSLGSIFPAVGNKFVLDGILPPVNQFTLSDAIQLSTFSMILAANVVTVVSYELSHHGKKELAVKINNISRYIITPFFTFILLFFIIKALLS